MKTKTNACSYSFTKNSFYLATIGAAICFGLSSFAQEEETLDEENVYELSPFEINTTEEVGYLATSTLAGTRIRTDLKDVGAAISVVTQEFLKDTGSTDNESLLVYTTGTETSGVGGTFGGIGTDEGAEQRNFRRPNTNNRVRGLDAADNTRNFFLTDIPWDSYNTERVDVQRGPNAILFGIGSPAGIINANISGADFLNNRGELEFRLGSYGTHRASFQTNQVLLENELAFRVAALFEDTQFKQDPAFERDRRVFIAGRYEPKFLTTENSKFTLKFDYEKGNIDSNRPRSRPPEDRITPWFTDAGKLTTGIVEGWVEDPENPNSNLVGRTDGPAAYIEQLFGGPNVYFENPADGNSASSEVAEIQMSDYWGLNANGGRDGLISGFPFQRYAAVTDYQTYAQKAGLPYANTLNPYVRKSLTDTSVFDYENKLLDGPTKGEWRDFEAYNISIEEHFFDGLFGFEATFDSQSYTDGGYAMLGNQQAITVDINTERADGSANPNLGRPVVYSRTGFGNSEMKSDRESYRVTAYADIDFEEFRQDDGWLTKLLGRHVLTGMFGNQDIRTEDRSWTLMALDGELAGYMGVENIQATERTVQTVSYLGASMLNQSSASGANLTNLTARQIPSNRYFHMFDSNWNSALGIDPGAEWADANLIGESASGGISTQSENPSNYLGWTDHPGTVLYNPNGTISHLNRDAQKDLQNIESSAFIWQAYLWDEMFVVTYGHRRDEAASTSVIAPETPVTRYADLVDSSYAFGDEPDNVVLGTGDSWSVVMHIPESIVSMIPAVDGLSLHYNESSNFQPAAGRMDHFGNPLGAPSGQTTDYGFTVTALDNKLSLRVNWYEAVVSDASFDPGNLWFVGGVETRAWKIAKRYEAALAGDPGEAGQFYTARNTGLSEAELIALQQSHVDGVLNNLPSQAFFDTWGADLSNYKTARWNYPTPPGFTSTSDVTSKGTEIELFYQPTDNWSIVFNAARVEAINDNIAGNLKEWVESRNEIWNGPTGDIRMWFGGGGGSIKQQWNTVFYSKYQLALQQEGTTVNEMREWRYNVVSNYRFSSGPLKGLNVGGSFRWEDEVNIGYPVYTDTDGSDKFDIDNPYKGPAESHVDFWVGYKRALTDEVDWKVQLNVRDAFSDGGLIPVSVQADGSPGGYRIGPSARWTLTNTFSF